MSPVPPNDTQTPPTRADLAAKLDALDAKVNTLTAAVVNTQAAVTALSDALLAAGVEPGILTAILTAARTD